MIYFYLYIFDNNNSNPLFHEEQLPAIATIAAALAGCFLTHLRAVHKWKFSHKKKQQQQQ